MRAAGSTRIAAGLLVLAGMQAAGAGRTPDSSPARSVDVLHYDVALSVDFDRKAVTSTTNIRLRAQTRTSELHFSGSAMALDTVSMAGRVLAFDHDEAQLTIHLPRPLERGQRADITVESHGTPRRGLEFDGRLAYTEYFTCDWMICAQEDFGDKASLRLTLTFPQGMSSVGPGRHVSRAALADGRIRDVWRESRPYSAYLFGFVVGEFTVAREPFRGGELQYLAAHATRDDLLKSFAPTPAMVKFFERRSGVPLPQPQYAQLRVPGDAAQESVSLSLIGTDHLDAMAADPGDDWAIAHELAHQWWGNSLTCTDLSQFWLNEGITVFMVAAWKEERWGRDAYDSEMQLQRQRVAAAKAAGVDRKLTSREPYPSLRLRRAIQYSKGALFMDLLRRQLGDELFWRAFRTYTRTHAGKSVTSRDLQKSFEASARRDLSPLFGEWVYDGGD